MITDADVAKILVAFKKVFATKDDLIAMEKRFDNKLLSMEARMDKKFATKDDIKRLESKIDKVASDLTELKEYSELALGNIFKWTDDLHKALIGKESSKKYI